jgi:hypothetical protein
MENIYLEWQRLRRIEKLLEEAKQYLWLENGVLRGTIADSFVTEPLFAKAVAEVKGKWGLPPVNQADLTWLPIGRGG